VGVCKILHNISGTPMTITTARHIDGGGRRREINVTPRTGPGVFNLLVTRGGEVVELERKRTERERRRLRD